MCYEGALVELSSIFGGKKGEKPSIEIARSCANKYTAQDGIGKTSGGKKPRITSLKACYSFTKGRLISSRPGMNQKQGEEVA